MDNLQNQNDEPQQQTFRHKRLHTSDPIYTKFFKKAGLENFLVVQWLGLSALTARAPGSIPG